MLSLGSIIYVILLLINAMAVLNEERFLVRSMWQLGDVVKNGTYQCSLYGLVGWASTNVQAQAAYAQPYAQPYDQMGAQQEIGVKGRLINLISAVRTLMRGMYNHTFFRYQD